mmetsp:Transcript_10260/g.44599  ORF Transcript_10260/g.44599 Transcript_10260/m.44599 type:complete len:201 (+) Transcript_10260:743-1345(+)
MPPPTPPRRRTPPLVPTDARSTARASRSHTCRSVAAATLRSEAEWDARYGRSLRTSTSGGAVCGAKTASCCKNSAASSWHPASWGPASAPPSSSVPPPFSPPSLTAATSAAKDANVSPPGSRSGPIAATAALTTRPHAARVSASRAAHSIAGEFIIANASRRAVFSNLANPGPTCLATTPRAWRGHRCVASHPTSTCALV